MRRFDISFFISYETTNYSNDLPSCRSGDVNSKMLKVRFFPMNITDCESGDGRLRSKRRCHLECIGDGESAMLYFWKLHNAVSSSFNYSIQYKGGELTDKEPWRCTNPPEEDHQFKNYETTIYSDISTVDTRNLGRIWPTADRFAFWLDGGNNIFQYARTELESAHVAFARSR